MKQPVLVIHGVGNRGKDIKFAEKVAALQARYPDQLQLIDIYWGDLAAEGNFIELTLPNVDDELHVQARRILASTGGLDAALGLVLLDDAKLVSTRAEERAATIASAAAVGAGLESVTNLESTALETAILERWSELEWLPRIEDPQVLQDAGTLIGELVAVAGERPPTLALTQGEAHSVEVEGLTDFIDRALESVDRFVGTMIGRFGGKLNRKLRVTFAPKLAGFFGDVIAYLRRDTEIYDLIRNRIEEEAPGAGTVDHPVGAIAHSLGGVILFDMATVKKDPLHIRNLLTFGSQAPFFHALSDKKGNALDEFKGDPIDVPPTIQGRWINLWELLDILAFVAAKVFRLANEPREPDDRMVQHVRTSGLWTHSAYWDLPEFQGAIRDAFMES